MAVLSNADRESLFGEIARDLSIARSSTSVQKNDLRAAVNASDDWAEANAASFNAALPQPARGALTAAQKARLLLSTIRKRTGGAI